MHFRAKASFCKGFALGFHLHILFLENICPLDLSAAENAALSLLNFYVVSLVKLFVGTLTSNNEICYLMNIKQSTTYFIYFRKNIFKKLLTNRLYGVIIV